jgi:hypothetical protein
VNGRTNQRKGADAERAVINLMRHVYGLPVNRFDSGSLGYTQLCDIALPGVAVEVRNRARVEVGPTLLQLRTRNPGDFPLLVMKPTGVGMAHVADWHVVTYLGDLLDRLELP